MNGFQKSTVDIGSPNRTGGLMPVYSRLNFGYDRQHRINQPIDADKKCFGQSIG
jgi:hypothetical protein